MESQSEGYRVYLSLAVILAKKRVDGNLTSRGENFDCLLQLTRSRQYPALEVQEWDKKAGGGTNLDLMRQACGHLDLMCKESGHDKA